MTRPPLRPACVHMRFAPKTLKVKVAVNLALGLTAALTLFTAVMVRQERQGCSTARSRTSPSSPT